MSTLPAIFNDALASVLAEIHPRTLLVIGRLPLPALDQYLGTHADCRILRYADPPAVFEGTTRPVDLAILARTLTLQPRREGAALLAQLRDLLAHTVVVIAWSNTDASDAWQPADFRAYGFRCLGARVEGDVFWQLHEFNIDTYKPTPEWLSSKHWANPELFDKFRW